MARVKVEGKFPKRIDDYVLYKLEDQIIMRAKSGFTTKALKTSPKYALSRQNASEFGRVSSTCKELRLALKDYLPKKNNLLVVNNLTKKMRQLLVFDTASVRGERTLAKALATIEAQNELKGFHFNPEMAISLDCTISNNQLQFITDGIVIPDGATCVSCTVLSLAFNFDAKTNSLCESDKHFYNHITLPNSITLEVPKMELIDGFLFTILVLDFYKELDGGYVPLEDDRSKVVVIV
ncbi:hypothetical protein GCM10022389_00150 [Flavobacterium cheonanense]|uniref:Uncharacterized protein n=1 Tax=Flavobacterium cheonanense TaxID=706183 RepID=A0ABP7V5Z4_9FLAO